MARVVFLGTPQAAVPTLQLVDAHHEVGLVVTQPDRPKGRSGTPSPPPVKETALGSGLPVSQPTNREELAKEVTDHGPFDVGVVVAYGRILRPEVLTAPAHGLLNVHFSLLPRWRGAAPVARALIAGDTMTGVTIIRLDEGLDTGPVLTAQAVDIAEDESAGDLTSRLASVGGRLLIDALPAYLDGNLNPVPQTDDGLIYADRIEASDRPIDVSSSPAAVVSQVRGLAPKPAATLNIDGEPHKILGARVSSVTVERGTWRSEARTPVVGVGGGAVELVTLQAPGRRPQTGAGWLRGRHRDSGVVG